MTTVEMWTPGIGVPGLAAERARRVEAEGWTGMGIVDSQCLSGDPYIAAALAGAGAGWRLSVSRPCAVAARPDWSFQPGTD